MKDWDIFQAALSLGYEWVVSKIEFNAQAKRLNIYYY